MKLRFTPPKSTGSSFYDGIDPMDNRYFDQELSQFLSIRARVSYQAYVEAILTDTYSDFDMVSKEIANEILSASKTVTPEEVNKEEENTRHDIKALVNVLASKVSKEARPFIHRAATSYDIVSTAQSLQYRDVTQIVIIPRLIQLENTLISLASKYSNTKQIGRTHGQHAVPITFGFAISSYISRLGQSVLAIEQLSSELKGKFAGAVGAYNAQSLFISDTGKFENAFLDKLGLKPAEQSTQIVPPEPLLRLIDELVLISGILANIATDMRHLQRSEIGELREQFDKNQTGSSTMAHKRNPIGFENVVSLHKQVIAQGLNATFNSISEHQRDLTDSASSRFYPIVFALVAEMAKKLDRTLCKIEVDESSMKKNLEQSAGAIAAEPLYLLLGKYGLANPHEKVKTLALSALDKNISFAEALQDDNELKVYWTKLTKSEQDIITNPEKLYLGKAREKCLEICDAWQKIFTQK
jgi:adenylosuccinate lyase